jgi:predicted alpha/beta hydrolase family esterase
MKRKKQLVYVPGGMTFKSRKDYLSFLSNLEVSLEKYEKWTGDYLDKKIGKEFDIIRLDMPNRLNAQYEDWKIYFERYIPLFKHDTVFIGYSLGGIFLAKYLSENTFPKRIRSVFLVAAPYDNSLPGEDLVNGFTLGKDLSLLKKSAKHLHLLFSDDDMVVPLEHMEKYQKKLPEECFTVYKAKGGHFRIPTFPELITMIKEEFRI